MRNHILLKIAIMGSARNRTCRAMRDEPNRYKSNPGNAHDVGTIGFASPDRDNGLQ